MTTMAGILADRNDLPAVLGWGVGLILAGAAIIAAAIAFLADYRGVARNYYESVVAAHRGIPGLGRFYERAYDKESSAGNFRISIGVGFAALGAAVAAIGILGLTKA